MKLVNLLLNPIPPQVGREGSILYKWRGKYKENGTAAYYFIAMDNKKISLFYSTWSYSSKRKKLFISKGRDRFCISNKSGKTIVYKLFRKKGKRLWQIRNYNKKREELTNFIMNRYPMEISKSILGLVKSYEISPTKHNAS